MGRAPCCEKVGLNRGAWTVEEDIILVSFIQKHGHANWRALPKQAGLLRCGKSCRLRWINYLRPDIKRGNFTREEEETIIRLHGLVGNKWSKIASSLPGRTDNEIKNVWNTHIKKRLMPKECYSSVKETKQQPSSPRSSSSMSSGDQNDNGEHDEPLEHEQKLDMEDNHDALNKITENYTELNSVTTKDIAMLDIQLDPWVVSEITTPSLSSNSAESFVGSSNLLADYEVDQVSLLQELDIPIEPEFWSFINDDSLLQNPDVGPSVEDGGHENPTISEDGERQRWVAYLEQELEL